MSPTIRISDAVYEALKARAEPFVDTPDSVLRQVLGLGPSGAANGAADANGASGADGLDGVHGAVASPPRTAAKSRRTRSVEARPKSRSRARAPKGELLASEAYELPILRVLDERGGRAPTSAVLDALESALADQLKPLDREATSTGEVRWRNRAQFARLRLVQGGELTADSERGVWEISDAGRQRLANRV